MSILRSLAVLFPLLCAHAVAQITHASWNGTQNLSTLGSAVASIQQPNGGRRLLISEPGFDHFVFPSTVNDTGAVRCFAGTDPGGPALFQVFGGSADRIGRSLAGLGDLNGDQYEDFAIGAPLGSESPTLIQEGFVLVCSGKDGAILFQLIGPQDESRFGTSVGSAGDVNNDGKDDIVVGAPEYSTSSITQTRSGRAYVYSGANGSLLQTFTGAPDSALGISVAGVGDVDGDGRADFAAGAAEADVGGLQSGRVVVVRGIVGTVWKNLYGGAASDAYGYAIASGDDANGDGVTDLIVGSPGWKTNRGLVEVLLGPSFATTYQTFVSSTVDDRMGTAVAFAGDVDQDGYADMVMGAPGVAIGPGKVYSRSGKTGATILPAQTGTSTGNSFGSAVAGAGDADGDGWDDVLVGEPFADVIGHDSGRTKLIGWQVVQPDVGGGGVGTTQLTAYGAALATGYSAQLEVSGGPPNAPAWLVVSASQLPLPFLGGTLIPNLSAALILPFPTDAQGEAKIVFPGGGGPFSIYVQEIVQDAAQVNGLQLTHCVRLDFLQ